VNINQPFVSPAYFLSSLPAHAQRSLDATRAHWSVENTFHSTLDVTFVEHTSRVRLDTAPEYFAVLRHIAFNLLKQHPAKASLKHLRAARRSLLVRASHSIWPILSYPEQTFLLLWLSAGQSRNKLMRLPCFVFWRSGERA
jgi:hypothetical protein